MGIADRLVDKVLVAGCGQGDEAHALARALPRTSIVGIDIVRPAASLRNEWVACADLEMLPFSSASFDCVYSYHVLEHVGNPSHAIQEIGRVLKPGGIAYIGFPNRNRIIGYVNAGQPFSRVIRYNLKDWSDRAKGRFRNEMGAHAGFAESIMRAELSSEFRTVDSVRTEYYKKAYKKHSRLIDMTVMLGLFEYVAPSNYFICRR